MKKISIVFGTRPEAIKLAPVILELKKHREFEVNICVTAQHRTMLDQILSDFEIKTDVDLNLMKVDQTLIKFTTAAISKLDEYYKEYLPDVVLVQGDTTTVFAASLAAFYNKIKIGHVEAGLRTKNKYSPYPEEINRVLTSHLADLHFAPTNLSKINLINEGIEEHKIFVTGNTVIDALKIAKEKIKNNPPSIPGLPIKIVENKKNILVTGHRRENFGEGFLNICRAIKYIAEEHKNCNIIYPVHLNPNVQKPVFNLLGNIPNIFLINPVEYIPFVFLMMNSFVILTDSGGIQEEAPYLGKQVLVMRENTERHETVTLGGAKLVGTNFENIIEGFDDIFYNKYNTNEISMKKDLYGDGNSAKRIYNHLATYLYPKNL